MKHFSEQIWTDFARGIASPTNRDLEAHLAAGCPECSSAHQLWKVVYAVGQNEPSLSPPDLAVHRVKVEFAARRPAEKEAFIMAKLMFDNLSQPLTAGVRSGGSDSRQLMFDAEGTMVDLVIDVHPKSGTISLVGQVVDKRGAKVVPRQVSVMLWTETGQCLAEASADQFGEFQMELPPQDRLRLSVEIVGHKAIRIPPVNLKPEVMPPVT